MGGAMTSVTKFRRATILLAEDDDDQYELARQAFEQVKHSGALVRARDGREVLDLLHKCGTCQDHPVDAGCPVLVLLDVRMPVMDGLETLREIKSHHRLRRVPVIMLTSSVAEDAMVLAYDIGANSFVRKPFTFEECLRVIAALKAYWMDVAELPLMARDGATPGPGGSMTPA